ncbi:MAG TPA: hypothetical protein VGB72_05895 [Acidobacteriota bacterium]
MAAKAFRNWELERFLLGELPARRMAEIRASLLTDPELARKIDELRRSDQDILAHYPPEAILPGARRQAERREQRQPSDSRGRPSFWRHVLYSAPILATAAVLLLVVLSDRTPSGIRIKGPEGLDPAKTQLLIYKKTNTGNVILKDGDTVRAGDLLQLAYVPAGKKYGMILSIDGNGVVTPHYPPDGKGFSRLKQEATVLLPNSYELDQAPEFERFFFITSTSDIKTQDILDKARTLGRSLQAARTSPLDLPGNSFSQFSILLRKAK